MKIAVISSTVLTCPPRDARGKIGYGGLEMIAWQQAAGLAKKGHKVMFVAPKGSDFPEGIEAHETTLGETEKRAYSGYWHKLPNYDCIIDHSWSKYATTLKIEGVLKVPILLWTHAPVNTMFASPPPYEKPCFVSISKDQAEHTKEHLGVEAKVCFNGVDTSFYNFTETKRTDRYLFLARISTIKGPDIAVDVAAKLGIGLDVVGDDTLTSEPALVNQVKLKCALTPGLRYIGPQERDRCVIWFNARRCLLHPNKHFREPFGLAPVESQLCGCPVIAWDNGAMRETIKHGETGFIVNSVEEIEELIKTNAVSSLKKENCREWAMQFSYENMVDRCEELCKEAEGGGW